MTFKDVGELHSAAVKSGQPEMFMSVLNAAAWAAKQAPPPSSPSKGGSCDGGALRVVNAKDFPTEIKPRECVVAGIIPEKHITTIYGSGGSTKSILGMSLSIGAARGDATWLDLFMSGKTYTSIFVDFELDLEAQASRAHQLAKGAGYNDLPKNFNYLAAGGQNPKEVFDYLYNYCKNRAVNLLVIDSVGLAMVGDAGAYRDVVTFFRDLDRFRIELGCTIVLIDHQANLAAGESYQAKAAFGSSYKGNLSRSRVQVELKEHAQGVRRIALRHNKANFTEYVDPFEVEVKFSEESITLTALKMSEGDLVEEEQLTSWKRALIFLYNDDEPKTRDDIRTALNIADGTSSNVIARLRKDGYASFTGDKSGNEQREVVITQSGKDYVEMFLREYREKGSEESEGESDDTPSSKAPPPPLPPLGNEDDGGASGTPPKPMELVRLIDKLAHANKVALDLETMPPEGWIWEVATEYRAWRRGLKNKPMKERMRAKWAALKDSVYKKYAVNPETAHVRLMSLATDDGLNEVVDVTHVDPAPVLEVLKNKTIIAHNSSFDLGVLRERYGYIHEGRVLDTQLLYVLHHYAEGGERSVNRDGKWRLPDPTKTKIKVGDTQVGMTSLMAVIQKYLPYITLDKSNQAEDWSVPMLSEEMIAYSLKDSEVLIELADVLQSKLDNIGMSEIVDDIESRTTSAKIWMERNGIPASKEVAEKMGLRYSEEALKALDRLLEPLESDTAPDGRPWSWTIDEHVRAALIELGANLEELTKTGKTKVPSTSKDSLKKVTGPPAAVEWVETYLQYQTLRKRSSDFIDKYAELVRENGTIPGRFDTISTGRFNCTKPNLQQVPSRGELQTTEGMRIRDIFRARPGESLIVADFEQVELLLAATIAERRSGTFSEMLEVFGTGGSDIHRATAAWVLGKPEADISKAERTLAKALNFGLIYGCSAEKLLEVAVNDYGIKDMTLRDAKKYRKAFFEKYPEFVAWHEKVSTECKRGIGYATTPRGRRRKLPKWEKSGEVAFTTAVNHPVQGAGADAIKLTLAKLFEDRHNCPGNPELNCTVHDEVILSVKSEHADAAKAWLEKHMADAEREAVMDSDSPIAVDVEAKQSWGG